MAIFLSRCDVARSTSLLYVIKKGFHPYVHFGHFLIQLFIGDDQIPQCGIFCAKKKMQIYSNNFPCDIFDGVQNKRPFWAHSLLLHKAR